MKKLVFAILTLSSAAVIADEDHDNQSNEVCPEHLTEKYVAGVWQGRIFHAFPAEAFVAHSRVQFHPDGTFSEQHEYYQPAVPTFPAAVLITGAQGYWKITGHNKLSMDVLADSEYAPGAPGDEAGNFFVWTRLTWTGTYNPSTCKMDGPWSGQVYTDYDSTTSVLAPHGTYFYKKMTPLF